VRWHADTEGERRTYHVPLPFSQARIRKSAEEHAEQLPNQDNFKGIISLLDGSAIGVISANDADRAQGTFSIAYYVEPEYRRRGYCTEAALILLRFYFLERRYQKANIAMYDFNIESQGVAEKLGFQFEGRQRRMQYTNGTYCDLLHYGLTIEEFREKHSLWAQLPT
jgi:RimJ/RimL family protein N-acetyltransferase